MMIGKKMIDEKMPVGGAAMKMKKRLLGMNKGGLKAELNNPAKGYTAGGMADYYKDLM